MAGHQKKRHFDDVLRSISSEFDLDWPCSRILSNLAEATIALSIECSIGPQN
jgi:hypothetical protein